MQEPLPKQKSRRAKIAKWVVGAFVVIYFFLPFAIIAPLENAMYWEPVDEAVEVFFAPLGFFADRIPPYGAFLKRQERLYTKYRHGYEMP